MTKSKLRVCATVTALCSGDHVALILDGTRAEESLPVRGARLSQESGGNEQDLGALEDQLTVELGEAHVIANAQPKVANWREARL
mgnify:CR=1 FL=1